MTPGDFFPFLFFLFFFFLFFFFVATIEVGQAYFRLLLADALLEPPRTIVIAIAANVAPVDRDRPARGKQTRVFLIRKLLAPGEPGSKDRDKVECAVVAWCVP